MGAHMCLRESVCVYERVYTVASVCECADVRVISSYMLESPCKCVCLSMRLGGSIRLFQRARVCVSGCECVLACECVNGNQGSRCGCV